MKHWSSKDEHVYLSIEGHLYSELEKRVCMFTCNVFCLENSVIRIEKGVCLKGSKIGIVLQL